MACARTSRRWHEPALPIDTRLSASDLFEMTEAVDRDPNAFGPEIRAALKDNPYGRHAAAQLAASSQAKPGRRR